MIQSALRLTATVLPGKRVEFATPELTEGESVEVIVLKGTPVSVTPNPVSQFKDAMEFLDSLVPIERTPEEWTEVEREFYEERNSWGD